MKIDDLLNENISNLLDKIEFDADTSGVDVSIPVNKIIPAGLDVYVHSINFWLAWDPDNGSGDLGISHDDVDVFLYGDEEFLEGIKEFMLNLGFPPAVVDDLDFSEGGMQDDNRASFDAYALEEWIRENILTNILTKDENRALTILKKIPVIVVHHPDIPMHLIQSSRTEIIKGCLQYFKQGEQDSAIAIVKCLKDRGINWPEFAAMEKSAGALSNK